MLPASHSYVYIPIHICVCKYIHTYTHTQMSENVAGLTFLALGNGAPDIFSMVAAAIASPHGVEMSLGEVTLQTHTHTHLPRSNIYIYIYIYIYITYIYIYITHIYNILYIYICFGTNLFVRYGVVGCKKLKLNTFS